ELAGCVNFLLSLIHKIPNIIFFANVLNVSRCSIITFKFIDMKSNITLLFLIIFSFIPVQKSFAQTLAFEGSGEYKFNESKSPCLTDEQRMEVKAEMKNG